MPKDDRNKEDTTNGMEQRSDANLELLAGKKAVAIGYGSQGHAHALNLKESGVDVRAGLCWATSRSWKRQKGLRVVVPEGGYGSGFYNGTYLDETQVGLQG